MGLNACVCCIWSRANANQASHPFSKKLMQPQSLAVVGQEAKYCSVVHHRRHKTACIHSTANFELPFTLTWLTNVGQICHSTSPRRSKSGTFCEATVPATVSPHDKLKETPFLWHNLWGDKYLVGWMIVIKEHHTSSANTFSYIQSHFKINFSE